MGGLIRAPKPKAPAVDSTAANVQAQADANAAAAANADTAAREARQKALDRARRGLAGTVATSPRAAGPDAGLRRAQEPAGRMRAMMTPEDIGPPRPPTPPPPA